MTKWNETSQHRQTNSETTGCRVIASVCEVIPIRQTCSAWIVILSDCRTIIRTAVFIRIALPGGNQANAENPSEQIDFSNIHPVT